MCRFERTQFRNEVYKYSGYVFFALSRFCFVFLFSRIFRTLYASFFGLSGFFVVDFSTRHSISFSFIHSTGPIRLYCFTHNRFIWKRYNECCYGLLGSIATPHKIMFLLLCLICLCFVFGSATEREKKKICFIITMNF